MNAVSTNGGAEDSPQFQATRTSELAGLEPSGRAAPETWGDGSAGNLDKIRDILFGANMRDYEQRFARLEEALKKESADLRETTRRQLETLESFVHRELAAIDARLNVEREERSENHSRLTAELSAHSAAVFKKIGDVESQEAQAKRDIRNDLLQTSKELNEAIRNKGEELITLIERRAQDLHHGKTDRAALANMFNELALRLTDQFKVTAG